MRFTSLALAGLMAFAARAPAQPLPELGDAAGAAIAPQVERRIGESIVREIRYRDPAYVDDAEISDFLDSLGRRLLSSIADARQAFEFFAVRDAAINAFALPGGFVGVHTGLLVAAESESELASVLAHEIAHVTQRHIARLIGAQQQMQLPSMVALAAAILLGGSRPDLAAGAAVAAQGGALQQQLSYTRDFEREADRVGFRTLQSAGFDVRAMPAFFEKMQRYGRLGDDGTVPSYLRTHPMTTERIADAQGRAASAPYRQHLDSLDFHLVRAKLRAESGEAHEAVATFSAAVRERRYANETAARYGLVSARLRARQLPEARADLAVLRETGAASPMIETLAARVRQASGDGPAALATLEAAQQRFPGRVALILAHAQALNQAGRFQEALAALSGPVRRHPEDARLRSLQAQTFAALGKRLLQHQAQAELYLLRGSVPAAIEQLQLARAAGDGNFYELSAVEARLKELRARHAQEQRDAKR
ncbi:MAG: M48 family metalloprotease [Betaproteobacteria bacterium]|nr:M48 family metalloprotease [Betaproteobacteria bacterium]